MLTQNLEHNISLLKQKLHPELNFDIVCRRFTVCEKNAFAVYIDGFADSGTVSKLFETLQAAADSEITASAHNLSRQCIPFGEVEFLTDTDGICLDVLSGKKVIIADGLNTAVSVDFRSYPQRAVSEPDKEKVMRGSKDCFVESLKLNASLIRRRIRSTSLCMEYFSVGSVSRTDVSVCYLSDKVNKKHLSIIKNRLRSIKTDALTMNQQSLADLLIKHPWIDPFPKFRYTERVDTASAQILEGDIIIIVDNAPSVMMMPVSLFDVMEEANDYYFPPVTGTYLRVVRYLVTLLTTFMTPLWMLCLMHPEYVPSGLKFVLLSDAPNIPIIVQLLLLEIAIDGLKLASLNTPSMMTTSMSMIGGIIVGDFAVKSGWFNSECMLYMAVVALAHYGLPSTEMSYALKFIRLITLLTTFFFGIYGFIFGILLCVFAIVFNYSPFGLTFIEPLVPFDGRELIRKFLRLKLKSKK